MAGEYNSGYDSDGILHIGGYGTYSYAQMKASGMDDPKNDAGNTWLSKPGIGGKDFGTRGFQLQMGVAAVSAASDIANAKNQADALKVQAGFTKFQAQENIKRGVLESAQAGKVEQSQLMASGERSNQVIAAQRSGYAAQGVNVNAGSALDVQVAEGKMSAIDSMTIRNNAALKVWGIQTGALQTAGQQEFQAQAEDVEAKQSLALGGAKAANQVMQQLDVYESMKMRGW